MPSEKAKEYLAYGRTYRVERCGTTAIWFAVGRGGRGHHVLDKLGGAESEEAMQHKLDAWARRQGIRPLVKHQNVVAQTALSI